MPTLSSTPEDKQQIREKIKDLLLPLPTSIHIEINNLIESLIKQALQKARAKYPLKCEFGHEVYAHKTADGYCCFCEADAALVQNQIDKALQSQLESLIDEEAKLYDIYSDNSDICVGIKIMADAVREKYDAI